jgi:hypothetical protein
MERALSLCVCQVLLQLVEEAGLPVGGPAYGPRTIAGNYRGLTVWRVVDGVSVSHCSCPEYILCAKKK